MLFGRGCPALCLLYQESQTKSNEPFVEQYSYFQKPLLYGF